MATVRDRIYAIRTALGDSQKQFAQRLGISKSAISQAESSNREVSKWLINLICRSLYVNEEYLKYGRGEMFIYGPDFQEMIEIYQKLSKCLKEHVFLVVKDLQRIDQETKDINHSNQ